MVEIRGLERRTSCMPCKRSSQLSYIPPECADYNRYSLSDTVLCCYNIFMPKTPKIKSLASGKRLTIIGAILLAIAGFFWWTNVFNNPENVFFGMLDNSLATSSVTRQVKEESAGGSVERFTRLQTGITNAAETLEI